MPLEQTIIQQIKNNSITTLDLSSKQIGNAEVKELANLLKDNKSITMLYFWGNQIGDAGAKGLAEALKDNQSITTLDLQNNQIGDVGAKGLAEGLKDNKSITTLYLNNNKIGEAGAKGLAEGLKDNKSITTLDLRYNQIGDAGAKDLAEDLKDNKSITTLYLNSNQIGDAGAKGLAEGLKDNQSITTLDLRYNQIGDAGAKGLAEGLKDNQSITTLRLDYNQIGDAGAKGLADLLKINPYITHLDLSGNQIGDVIMKEIATALNINRDFANKARQEAAKLKQQQQAEAAEKARQEAERLEQEAKLKEQEETNKLKVLEEAKVKEYIPNIPVVKLFEVEGGDDQFDKDDQATIRQVSNLIRDGNDRLQEHVEKGVLVVGDTGSGKSTLTHALAGRKLQAIFDDEIKEFVIDAMQPLADIVIGHKMASETKIPNKCVAKGTTIWDCPGFNDTELVLEIVNRFYIKRLFETTEQLKFVLVVNESDLRSKRGNDFLETLSNFIKSFKDIGSIEGSISLIFTHVPPNKNMDNIKNSIDKILTDNQRATDEHKALINNCSIHLFYKPTTEGELVVPDLLAAIEESSKYSDVKDEMVNITISKKAMECSSHLLNTASSNFNQLLEVIVKAIGNATQCSNVNPLNAFSENYNLVKDWVPSSINYNELKQHSEGEYFLGLELLSRLQKVLNKQIESISDAITILQIAVDIFAEYAESDNSQLKHQIQDYGYCLQQQYDYVKFFSTVCKAELPEHAKIAELITACHTKVTENLEYQVSSFPIDENQSDPDYYSKAIEYLENYQDSPACKNLKAIAYSCLASIAEKDGANEASLVYYAKAIDANIYQPKIYEKLGQFFLNKGEYAKAIDCYKVVNNEFEIKACFKAWLEQDKRNPDIMLKQAEYFESICLFEQAKKYYHHAFSLSHDENFKVAVLEKIKTIVNVAAQGQDFIARIQQEPDFCNYDLVNEEFTKNLLGDVVLKCDLYC
ncbi:hypothetical protein [Candidatus Tisiphia endosymbiont of Hybos culiciformis]|uniref:hypothetical protein n=1 Tax=Candidatus Tisiphia endosymbiont of Hybos culiciformis TaxID=3139331 RepID=UPI003CCB1D62